MNSVTDGKLSYIPSGLSDVLPAGFVLEEAFGRPDWTAVWPEEEALSAEWSTGRQAEFGAARACAHRALARLGVDAAPVLRKHSGEPAWPTGVVGSITHCAGYRAAVVGSTDRGWSVGIDAETVGAEVQGMLDVVTTATERATLPPDLPVSAGLLVFCAKEAIYKAWYPIAQKWLGFDDVAVSLGAETFTAQVAGVLQPVQGHWLVQQGLVITAASWNLTDDDSLDRLQQAQRLLER